MILFMWTSWQKQEAYTCEGLTGLAQLSRFCLGGGFEEDSVLS